MPNSTRKPPGERPGCLILGCGGHGRVVLDVLRNEGRFEPLGFVDSNPAMVGRRVDGIEVLGTPDDLPRLQNDCPATRAIVAIGNNGVRRALADRLENEGYELISTVHPSANVALNASVGRNVVIAAGALVCAHCQIGDSVILNTGSIVDHESLIGTATHVCPGARLAGRVTIESGAFVGIGATIIQNVRVGCEAVIGAGAVVINDVAALSTVVGVPARSIKMVRKDIDVQSWMAPDGGSIAAATSPAPAARA